MAKFVQYRTRETVVKLEFAGESFAVVISDEYDSRIVLATFTDVKGVKTVRLHDDVKILEPALEP